MTRSTPRPAITKEGFDAVLFDLDGVLTDTARVHAASWKRMFDEFLRERSAQRGEPFVPFDTKADYLRYVDGKLRYDGVRSFLESRGIKLPDGEPDAPPGYESVTALGNLKDRMVKEILRAEGAEVYEGSVALVRHLRSRGIKTGVVSASKNCGEVLRAAGIEDLFDVQVDGEVADRLRLPGKPEPDSFLEAARELGVYPGRAVVVEDAISGVQAGRKGGFGLVVGVSRKGDAEALRQHGADVVVSDLQELLT
jgi:beta-phosphoglucomutase family hydrolase